MATFLKVKDKVDYDGMMKAIKDWMDAMIKLTDKTHQHERLKEIQK